jgi:hypothetical protein
MSGIREYLEIHLVILGGNFDIFLEICRRHDLILDTGQVPLWNPQGQ